ncbi:hypothetical protein EMMF5_004759 [Cystobasidiomycetes sp. EMM_F5]
MANGYEMAYRRPSARASYELLPGVSVPSRRSSLWYALPALALAAVVLGGFSIIDWSSASKQSIETAPVAAFEAIFANGLNHNATSPWTDPDSGITYTAKHAHWSKLNKKLCIVNIDTRPITLPSYASTLPEDYFSATAYSHLLYALRHGYAYQTVHAPPMEGRYPTWVKVPHIRKLLRDYELVVFLDGDVQMNHPELPIEWLLNRWDFAPTSLMAMAEDPTSDDNRDKNGKIALNTGFVVVRNDARSFQLLDELIACPDVLPGCEVTAHEWSHEQRAFKANGYEGETCDGVFVKHRWSAKHQTTAAIHKQLLGTMYFMLDEM